MRRIPLSLAVATAGVPVVLAMAALGPAAQAGVALPTFHAPSRADDPSIGGVSEPATVYAKDGTRYVAYQGGSQLSYTRDGGRTWVYVKDGGSAASLLSKHVSGCTSATDIGDVDLTTDASGRVWFADLQGTAGPEVSTGIEPIVGYSDDRFGQYQATCAAHQPTSVDREWLGSYTAKGKGPNSANVYLSYHDFGESMIWVNASHDGGKTWSLPVPAITTPSALATSACNTVPGGTAIDQRNGWIYAAWTAGSNAADNVATGCNYTQGAVFNNLFVAVSKDGGKTFTDTLAVSTPGVTDVNAPSDLSEIFSSISVDREGGVYVAYPAFVNGEYGAYLAYSPPADASGTLHFGRPLKVDPPAVHTAYFVRTIAGDRGRADVIFLGSPVRNIPATAANDAAFTGANPNQPNCVPEVTGGGAYGVRFPGKPCEMPAKSPWYLYLAQTLNLTSGHPTVTDTKLRPDAVHTGDICTLGIFCLPSDDRDLADVYDVKIDNTGGAQIAYTAETPNRAHNEIDFQCQSGGPGLYAGVKVRDCQAPAGRAAAVVPGAPGALPVAFGTGRGSPVAEGLGLAAALVLLVGAGLASLRRLRPVGIATA